MRPVLTLREAELNSSLVLIENCVYLSCAHEMPIMTKAKPIPTVRTTAQPAPGPRTCALDAVASEDIVLCLLGTERAMMVVKQQWCFRKGEAILILYISGILLVIGHVQMRRETGVAGYQHSTSDWKKFEPFTR